MSQPPPPPSAELPPQQPAPGGAQRGAGWRQSGVPVSDFTASVNELLDMLREPAPGPAGSLPGRRAGWPWLRPVARVGGMARRVLLLLRALLRRWLRFHPGIYGRIAETLLWPAFFIYLGWVSNPDNPFYINEGFPWPWIGPWLIALRYGVGWGAAAALGLLGAWSLMAPLAVFPRLYFLGGAIMTLVAGEFGGYWSLRALRLREATRFLSDKVERLTRRLYLVKLSHDELEYELVDQPGTLRGALQDLRIMMERQVRGTPGERASLPAAQTMLDFIGLHCRIESAALYELRTEPALRLLRVAAIGELADPPPDDPMVLRAIETGRQIHLQETLLEKSHRSALIAAAPLLDGEQQPFGLMVIKSMPFTALTAENLQTVAVLLESYADYLRLARQAVELMPLWPDAPRGLAGEFAWLARLRGAYGLQSHCVVWRVAHERQQDVIDDILQLHSRGETAWPWPGQHGDRSRPPCVIALVPFAAPAAVRIYKQRIVHGVQRSFGDLAAEQLHAFDFSIEREAMFGNLRAVVEHAP